MTRLFALIALLALSPLGAGAEDAIRLAIPEARKVAAASLKDGDAVSARQIAQTLLRRDSADFTARLILAQAEFRLGRLAASAAEGRRAFAAARDDTQRYLAANVTAGAFNQMGAQTRAQFWLRRAAQAAPNPGLERQAAQHYRQVRADNPLSFGVKLGVRPSTNINNGSQHDREVFGGLSRDLDAAEKALSGMEYALGFDLRYRLDATGRSRTWLAASGDAQLYTLSDSAKRDAPRADASDYAYRMVSLGFGHSRDAPSGRAQTTLTFDLSHSWTGRSARNRSAELALTRRFLIGDRTQAHLRVAAQRNQRLDARRDDATLLRLSAGLTRDLGVAGQFGAQIGFSRSVSDSYRTAWDALALNLSYDLPDPVMGTDITLWAGVQQRDYDLKYIVFDPRSDTRTTLGATLFFSDLDAYGFAPTLDIGISRNASNVGAYDGQAGFVGIGFKSTF